MGSAVVVDLGSNTIKCGLALSFQSETRPGVVSPSWVKRQPQHSDRTAATESQAVRQGQTADWAAVECILYNALYMKLGWELGGEGQLLIAEALCTSRDDREKLAQIAFEVFNVTGLFFADHSVLSLYAIGKSTGVVIDMGHEKTDISVVVDGQLYLPSVRRLAFGGRNVTIHLQQLLADRGTVIEDLAVVERLKEIAASAEDGNEAEAQPKSFVLPDGRLVSLSSGDSAALASCLLHPSLMDITCPSVVETAAASIFSHLDPAVRKAALDSVLVCGGGSLVPGIAQKLCRELRQLLPPSMPPCACSVPEYMPSTTLQYSAYMGGAVLSKILMQHNHYVSKADYEEYGPPVVHRKVGL